MLNHNIGYTVKQTLTISVLCTVVISLWTTSIFAAAVVVAMVNAVAVVVSEIISQGIQPLTLTLPGPSARVSGSLTVTVA